MKKSKYNFFFPTETGEILAFNAVKNGLAVIDTETADVLENFEAGAELPFDNDFSNELKRGGFVCTDDYDEYGLLTVRRHMQQYSSSTLGLTIAPTVKCNLACEYCFESPNHKMMDEKTMKALVEFVKGYIDGGIKGLNIVWYGGEPLLCQGIIEKLSKEFRELCDENKVGYKATIVTNGTLFTKETALKLKSLGVKSAQITLDGLKEIHDKRRPYVGGKGSFDRIVSNLREAAGIIPIVLRVNVDITNVDSTMDFFKELEKEEWFNANLGHMLHIDYGYVRKYTSACQCSHEESLKEEDYWKNELELKNYLFDKGVNSNFYPAVASGCGATSTSSYVVGPEGEFYKCWNHVGNPEMTVGSVFEPIEMNALYISNLVESFEKEEECRDCKYLPICMGGCVDIRLRVKDGSLDFKNCAGWKYYLEDSLKMTYLSKLKETAEQSV